MVTLKSILQNYIKRRSWHKILFLITLMAMSTILIQILSYDLMDGFPDWKSSNSNFWSIHKRNDRQETNFIEDNGNYSSIYSFNYILDRIKSNYIDRWQEVEFANDKFYVFSAFYDNRSLHSPYIRVIAAAKTKNKENVICKFWFSQSEMTEVDGMLKIIRENWNLKYSAYFIICPLQLNSQIPNAVTVMIKSKIKNYNKKPTNRLKIYNNLEIKKQLKIINQIETKIAVCVKPLHYKYNKALNLIEFIEMNRLLGVSYFIFYNNSIGPAVDRVLTKYSKDHLASVLPWKLNMVSQKEIRTEGLFAALNDCLYRTMHLFNYVLMIDLDEFIIPHMHRSLIQLLDALKLFSKNGGAYSFQNAFFYLQWPDDTTLQFPLQKKMTTLRKTQRKKQLNLHKQRSKCIVIPEDVIEIGNHFVWEFVSQKHMINISPKIAFLHHYRICEFGGDDCVNAASVSDRRTHLWKHPLLNSINSRLQDFHNCNFTD